MSDKKCTCPKDEIPWHNNHDCPVLKAESSFAAPTGLAGQRVCENDFVFLDHRFRPYRVRKVGGDLWLHYWQNNQWASLRKVSDDEALQYIESALPPVRAKLYEADVPFLAS